MTRGVADLVASKAAFAKFCTDSLYRHASGDWGNLSSEDKVLYHAGDTDAIPEMATVRADVALLPVSGTYVMTVEEAAQAAAFSLPAVRALTPSDVTSWNAFVVAQPDGTFFHLAEWQYVLKRSFGLASHYLLAEGPAGEIRGVLPLARVKSLLFGDALVSTPFCVYGGVLAADDDAHVALTRAACVLARKLNVDHLEMRNRKRQHPDWPCKDLYVTFR
jgi:hypothetical protein